MVFIHILKVILFLGICLLDAMICRTLLHKILNNDKLFISKLFILEKLFTLWTFRMLALQIVVNNVICYNRVYVLL